MAMRNLLGAILCCGLVLAAVSLTGCGQQRVATPVADLAAVDRLRGVLGSAATPAADSATEAAPTGTGWATLKGRFIFTGTPGEPQPLKGVAEKNVCSKDGKDLVDRSLIVDPATKGLANVVIFARKTSRVKEASTAAKLTFDQKHCEFIAPVFAARVGQPVDIRNSDPIGHNTNIEGTSFNQLIPAGSGAAYAPEVEFGMPKKITCNIHPWMKAYGIFRKDGYVSVSAADGSFQIPDLPAGETIELQVWHERAKSAGNVLSLQKPELKWTPKGRFQVRLEADEVKDLGTIEVPGTAVGE
ncbi:hypothetical protein LBMAG47_16980 [Planctomycetia bacterium]|nr:hypothetical protein LBMAG47_16980 [Planctomycetia bacterium]